MSTAAVPVVISKPIRNITGLNTAGSSSGPGTLNPATGTIQLTSALQETVIEADAVVEEDSDDEMVVTDHPVEVGATISDHAYSLPAQLGLIYAWSLGSNQNTNVDPETGAVSKDSDFLKKIYQQLLSLKAGKVLCTVNTGKRVYQNMLIIRLSQKTDKENENSLTVRVGLKEILMATTQAVPLTSAAVQAFPQNTAPTVNQGAVSLQPGTNFNPAGLP
jgi:hypothetical protein